MIEFFIKCLDEKNKEQQKCGNKSNKWEVWREIPRFLLPSMFGTHFNDLEDIEVSVNLV